MKQILIIDDDEKLGKLLVQYLERYDMKVHVALTPSKGFELIKKIKPDLLILDECCRRKMALRFAVKYAPSHPFMVSYQFLC